MNRPFILTVIALCFILQSCSKNSNIVPNVHFDSVIYLLDPKYRNKDVFTVSYLGYAGVIVCKAGNVYNAFEMYCPHDQKESCKVSRKDNTTAICNCCKTEYLIATSGEVIEGASKYSLKQYNTEYSINNYLRIWN
ncbi:MAG: Rieske 2Fe-2S domain-containing protein [Cytophagaceae bacterium]|nr:Rieske 2Fe-2S domain-containing protein [Cytophagaceae bacterium]